MKKLTDQKVSCLKHRLPTIIVIDNASFLWLNRLNVVCGVLNNVMRIYLLQISFAESIDETARRALAL